MRRRKCSADSPCCRRPVKTRSSSRVSRFMSPMPTRLGAVLDVAPTVLAMSDDRPDRPIRQAAGAVGGFLIAFVLGDAGLASNGVGTIALAVGGGLVGFALVR